MKFSPLSRAGSYQIPHKHRRFRASIRDADWWIYEVLSLLISASALIAMVVFLSKINNQPQPSWAAAGRHCTTAPGSDQIVCRRVGISVNSVVSWLGTIARISLLVPLSNGLGQLKWSWFIEKERSLRDLSTFDYASRGITGSLQLIWRLKARYFASIGALGIILSIAFDPFIQNLVEYYTQPVLDPSQISYISNNSIFDAPSWSSAKYLNTHPTIKASVWNALYSSDPRQFWSQPQYLCNTGDCAWPPLASISMCTFCEDTTARVLKTCNSTGSRKKCTLTLPASEKITSKTSISYTYSDHELFGDFFRMSCNQGSARQLDTREIASIYLDVDPRQFQSASDELYNFPVEGPAYVSSNCTLVPCVQSIKSVYKQSSQIAEAPYREEILKTWRLDDYTMQLHNTTLPIEPEYGLNNQTFGIGSNSFSGIANFFGDNFNGHFSWDSPSSSQYSNGPNDGPNSADVVFAIWNANYTGQGCVYKSNRVSCAMELISKAISKTFRDQPWATNGTLGTMGESYSPVIFVRVTWYWILVPAVIWALALITFLGTAWEASTPGLKVWRNDPLPLVYMTLCEEQQRVDGVSQRELVTRAKGSRKRLQIDDRSIQMVSGVSQTVLEPK